MTILILEEIQQFPPAFYGGEIMRIKLVTHYIVAEYEHLGGLINYRKLCDK